MKKELPGILDPELGTELLINVTKLVEALKNGNVITTLPISTLITSTLQLSTQILRQINDNEPIEDLGNFAAMSCSLRENLHFYWRWICENKPAESNPRINELIRSQQIVKPKCWILLDVTKRDQPVLIEKQVDPNFCNSLSAIYSAIRICEFEAPEVLNNHFVTRQLKTGSLVVVQSSWFENGEMPKKFWRAKLSVPENKSRKHLNLYTVYSSQ